MNKKPKNHFESYEAACADRGYDPEACIPKFSEKAPAWLKTHLETEAQLLVIAEAIRQGRVPKPDERMYFCVFFKDAENDHAGFGLAVTISVFWDSITSVGERQQFFSREDAVFFGNQYLALHKITKVITKIEETNVQ